MLIALLAELEILVRNRQQNWRMSRITRVLNVRLGLKASGRRAEADLWRYGADECARTMRNMSRRACVPKTR